MTGLLSLTIRALSSITPLRPSRPLSRSDEINLSTGRPLISDLYDTDWYPCSPEGMHEQLELESERRPYEMSYTHAASEEIHRFYWTGIVRDWHKVQVAMDRETQVMQRNN